MKPLFAKRILALSVDGQSFGFVVFDGPRELMDWGTRSFRGGVNAVKVPLEAKLLLLLDAHRPDALVVMKPKTRKREMIVAKITNLARTQGIPVAFVSGTDVRTVFAPQNQSKYHIAAAIATRYPELLPRLPLARKPWQSEKHGITIFEAAAVGSVYYGEKISPHPRVKTRILPPVPAHVQPE
jgi:hypothetical protein